MFVSPVSIFELMVATCIMGIIKAVITAVVLGSLAFLLYAFNIVSIGILLLPFLISLLLFGWALGMVTMALILRFGKSAEALVWGIPFLIQPFSAVFYPVEVLPDWLQVVAYAMPSTYVFEGMREVLSNGGWLDLKILMIAFSLNILYLVIGAIFFGWMFSQVREKGYLTRLGME